MAMIVLIQQNAALHSGLWSSKATWEAYKKDKKHWSHLVKFHKHVIIQSYQDYTLLLLVQKRLFTVTYCLWYTSTSNRIALENKCPVKVANLNIQSSHKVID